MEISRIYLFFVILLFSNIYSYAFHLENIYLYSLEPENADNITPLLRFRREDTETERDISKNSVAVKDEKTTKLLEKSVSTKKPLGILKKKFTDKQNGITSAKSPEKRTVSNNNITTAVEITTVSTPVTTLKELNSSSTELKLPVTTTIPMNVSAANGGSSVPAFDQYYDEDTENESLSDLLPELPGYNKTVDHHRYYYSEMVYESNVARSLWVDLGDNATKNSMLSDSYRRALTVTLTFDFPFYGHPLRNITVATGGFLYTGEFLHTWLAATQYIAPLMANFDTSVSNESSVKYSDNGTSFTVQWENVSLKDHKEAGNFTFQVTLHHSGEIVFAYKMIPIAIFYIEDAEHPVKVGLSDAYIVDRTIFYVRRKTIYEYHKIDKKHSLIANWTAILFKPLPTCVAMTTCNDCLHQKSEFKCQWCNKIGRCSSGLDRYRQDWIRNDCETLNTIDFQKCDGLTPPPTSPWPDLSSNNNAQSNAGVVVAVIFVISILLGIGGWITYAYFFPHTTSGQFLIKYRPSTWSWRRGEPRYTVAAMHSIHM